MRRSEEGHQAPLLSPKTTTELLFVTSDLRRKLHFGC